MATFFPRCNKKKKFLLFAATALFSIISTIYIMAIVQREPVIQVPLACAHRIDSMDVHGPDKEWHTGGWAVRQLCSQPLDTLFFVHVAPSKWERRIHLRATLFEEAARAAFNWTGVFFVGQDEDPLVNLWTKLEAEVTGDVVVFPYNDSFFTIVNKIVRGMRWVSEYCPRVRHIVKIDHDVGVQPFELRRYLNENLPLENSSIHCSVWKHVKVLRDGRNKHCVPEDQLAMDYYPLYCSGRAMAMTMETMGKLYRASHLVKGYQIDDTYVSGHLALLANVGHVDITKNVSWDENRNMSWDEYAEGMLEQNVIFTHDHSDFANSFGHRALWVLVLWAQAPGRHAFNSSNQLVDQAYARAFRETRRALAEGLYLPRPILFSYLIL